MPVFSFSSSFSICRSLSAPIPKSFSGFHAPGFSFSFCKSCSTAISQSLPGLIRPASQSSTASGRAPICESHAPISQSFAAGVWLIGSSPPPTTPLLSTCQASAALTTKSLTKVNFHKLQRDMSAMPSTSSLRPRRQAAHN